MPFLQANIIKDADVKVAVAKNPSEKANAIKQANAAYEEAFKAARKAKMIDNNTFASVQGYIGTAETMEAKFSHFKKLAQWLGIAAGAPLVGYPVARSVYHGIGGN